MISVRRKSRPGSYFRHSAPPNRSLDYSEIHPPAVAVAVAIAGDGDGQLQSGQPTPYPYPALPDRRRNIVDEPAREHRWRREHPWWLGRTTTVVAKLAVWWGLYCFTVCVRRCTTNPPWMPSRYSGLGIAPIRFFIRSICHRIEGICGRFGCSCMDSKLPEREQCQVLINLELSEIIPERIQFLIMIMRLSTFTCSCQAEAAYSTTVATIPPYMVRFSVFSTLQ